MFKFSADRWLGVICLIGALSLIFVWIPMDTESGYLEKVRRAWILGDALAPTVAGFILLIGSLMLLIEARGKTDVTLDSSSIKWIFFVLCIVLLALTLMRLAGPLVTSVFSDQEYRLLRDTAPWKYIGYILGGTVLTSGLMCLVERQVSARLILIGAAATLALMLIYDLPFDDILLPPNGDV